MDKLADLPPFALITFGATLAVIFAARYLGFISADKGQPVSAATVASVIVDPSALIRATDSVDRLTHSLDEHRAAAKDETHMVCRRLESLVDEVESLSGSLDKLTLELARKR